MNIYCEKNVCFDGHVNSSASQYLQIEHINWLIKQVIYTDSLPLTVWRIRITCKYGTTYLTPSDSDGRRFGGTLHTGRLIMVWVQRYLFKQNWITVYWQRKNCTNFIKYNWISWCLLCERPLTVQTVLPGSFVVLPWLGARLNLGGIRPTNPF